MARLLNEIARDIVADYAAKGKPVHPYAAPYVEAMLSLDNVDEMFFADPADMIVRYALSNLSTWRGEKAKAIKAELKEMLKN